MPLSVDDLVLDRARYAAVRDERRAAMIARRRGRRVHLGDRVAVEFENDDTLRYQAQEMLYVEGVADERTAAAEIAVYERLLPGPRTLTATMLIELQDQDTVKAELQRLSGLQHRIVLQAGAERVTAEDVPPPDEGLSETTYSVHFLRFRLSDTAAAALVSGEPARLSVEHPAYDVSVDLPAELVAELAADLGRD